jgi:hypothetical protein
LWNIIEREPRLSKEKRNRRKKKDAKMVKRPEIFGS